MSTHIYNPFSDFRFDNQTCFLSGQPLRSADEQIQVFPHWLMRRFDLEDKPFKLLDESIRTYKQLQLPCATVVAERIAELDRQVEQAFDSGYRVVKDLDSVLLFQWVAKLVYGVVFNEIQAGIRQQLLSGEAMNFSQVLAHKFKNLHLMLQSLIMPMQFDGATPFSVVVAHVDNPQDTFSYRDEINTLVYSLRMNDFGLIVCLQDNGTNNIYHGEYLEKVNEQVLHPIQFEELCARYFYSAYLFSRLPEYTILPTPDRVYVEPMPLADMSMRPMFDHWQIKTFGQVLENFWKPWGYSLFEIIKNPEHPMSFLLDDRGDFIPANTISLAKE
ncbi:hypothetical protein [Parapedobacter koreensis]|uniref:Uncharacterized protein n=1 Tax=Parapedobacter koreensis TaxID=332977 RepID=A0A1H7R4B7_9SPHI|nr:hypothetical protein [Parapedobacter koreensis]SEL55023.1 hypothetical protein SAMN05421740_106268 [Parapedobacter koreensis]